ncbi:MAG: glutamate-5-semialdehyde dehydrogenase, partial [Oscillospiraceae bacterium]
MSYIQNLANKLKAAQPDIAHATTKQKNDLLLAMAQEILEGKEEIIKANAKDLLNASCNGVRSTMIDRLRLNEERIDGIVNAIKKIVALPDPVGVIVFGKTLPNGLKIKKQRIPIGVIGIIYESRPNVTVDAASLCIKSSNAVMLRGGKEAIETNIALINLLQSAIIKCGMNPDIITLVEDTSRETSLEMMKLNGYLDVLIPRGGAGLIKAVVEDSTIPVIVTGVGNCHIFVDESADLEMAAEIVFNAKTSRPSVCNSCESLLVHESVAPEFLTIVKNKLDTKAVIMLGCEKTKAILGKSV